MKVGLVILVVGIVIAIIATVYSGVFDNQLQILNKSPIVEISNPENDKAVSRLVMISGTAVDPDSTGPLTVEIKIGKADWTKAEGSSHWSYDWNTHSSVDGTTTIQARAFDGKKYSEPEEVSIVVDNAKAVNSNSHRWAIFIATGNFPKENDSKLGNGGLYLAEQMAGYFVETLGYDTSHVIVLFDDGWVRLDNGYGSRVQTLQERPHLYEITYGGATRVNVMSMLEQVINESNQFEDSEVFLWFFNHGYGDASSRNGGKLFEQSALYLWDSIMTDKDLGDFLGSLTSNRVAIIVDACYSGGFADRTIANIPTSILSRSGIPQAGRVVMTGTSKFTVGYASLEQGPLFSLLWFEGLQGAGDGFRPGLLGFGRPGFFKDGQVSAEEAFYYAKYVLRTSRELNDYDGMRPQINDRFPRRFLDRDGLILGGGS